MLIAMFAVAVSKLTVNSSALLYNWWRKANSSSWRPVFLTAMSWLLRQGLSRPIYQNPMQEGCRVMHREKIMYRELLSLPMNFLLREDWGSAVDGVTCLAFGQTFPLNNLFNLCLVHLYPSCVNSYFVCADYRSHWWLACWRYLHFSSDLWIAV